MRPSKTILYRWLRRGAVALAAATLCVIGLAAGAHYLPTYRLQCYYAEIAKTDPHWRIEEIEAERAQNAPPKEENGMQLDDDFAFRAGMYRGKIQDWPNLDDYPPVCRLNAEQRNFFSRKNRADALALQEARKMCRTDRAYAPFDWQFFRDKLSPFRTPWIGFFDQMATDLHADVLESLDNGETAELYSRWLASVNCSACLQGDPTINSQWTRLSHQYCRCWLLLR